MKLWREDERSFFDPEKFTFRLPAPSVVGAGSTLVSFFFFFNADLLKKSLICYNMASVLCVFGLEACVILAP